MSFTSPPITDEDLHAFIDNEVDDDKHEAILAYLATTPADTARVEAWRQQNILLRAAFSQVALEQVPANLAFTFAPRLVPLQAFSPPGGTAREAYPRHLWRRSLAFTVAAFIAGACIALAASFSMSRYREFVAGEFTDTASAPGAALALLASAALPHAPTADVTDVFSRSAPDTPGALAPALSLLPALKLQGLELLRGEIRGAPTHPANCLDFEDTAGTPIVLCIAAAAAPPDSAFRGVAVVSTNSVYWRESESLYALAAPLGSDRLLDLARRIHTALAGRRPP